MRTYCQGAVPIKTWEQGRFVRSLSRKRQHPVVATAMDADLVVDPSGVRFEVVAGRQQAAERGRAEPRAAPHRLRPVHLQPGSRLRCVSATSEVLAAIGVCLESRPGRKTRLSHVHVDVEAEYHRDEDAQLNEGLPAGRDQLLIYVPVSRSPPYQPAQRQCHGCCLTSERRLRSLTSSGRCCAGAAPLSAGRDNVVRGLSREARVGIPSKGSFAALMPPAHTW